MAPDMMNNTFGDNAGSQNELAGSVALDGGMPRHLGLLLDGQLEGRRNHGAIASVSRSGR